MTPEAAGKKKKRRNKKRATVSGDGRVGEEAADELDETASVPAVEMQPAVTAASEQEAVGTVVDVHGDEDECDGDAAQVNGGGKKKRKSKKKQSDKAEVEVGTSVSAEGDAAPEIVAAVPVNEKASAAKPCDGEDADAGEESGEEEQDGAPSAAKKKKKKKKKSAAAPLQMIPTDGVRTGVTKYIIDEAFEKWAADALSATLNGSEKMTPEDRTKPPQAFWNYKYTGNLRPSFVTSQMRMPADILKPDYATDLDGVSASEKIGQKEVPILEGKDLQTMREACRFGREVLDIAARFMRAGVTGDEIDRIVYQACVDRRIYPSPLNYYRFPKAVCVSPNEVICHGIPDCRPIEEGDIVNLDVSIFHQGFHADLNETFFIGECDEDAHRVVKAAYCALHAASEQIRPGTFYRDLGNVIHAEATKSQCAVVTTYCGHGVGQLFHGPPKIPHYRKNKAVGIMKPGHIFTIEPMLNLGTSGADKTWPDNWTAVTKDGNRSAQFEHTFLVTETGVELLTCRAGTSKTAMPPYDPKMFQL
eukprot:TRINITY_DN602_c0_g3_i1.p1 TRINITY_DN602_c0_g3~~TRINITY_DN602_c0_g3_i1.p1  ORF type:complete len:559 (-),score=117.73 TRINITY_DN602_c0_g3_i1:93-1688(-)